MKGDSGRGPDERGRSWDRVEAVKRIRAVRRYI